MSKEILAVVEIMSNEKEVDKEIIFEAIESALAVITRKKHNDEIDIMVEIDRKTGDYSTYKRMEIIDDDLEVEDRLDWFITIKNALKIKDDAQVGGFVYEQMESIEFGRIGAQGAKQIIMQKIREAERKKIVDIYSKRIGEILTGQIKRIDRGDIILELGENIDAIIPRNALIPRESFRIGDRVKAYVKEVEHKPKGPQVLMCRNCNGLLSELFKLEVPEIGDDLIDIMSVARDPGFRAKVAVRANDSRLDPIGSCIGIRGSRIQAVVDELNGERIDVVLWDSNDAQFVINSMIPAEVTSIIVDEDKHSMDIAVDDEKLSQAIGKNGQNIRLASELTGWELNVMTQSDMQKKSSDESENFIKVLVEGLDIEEELAEVLVQEGYSEIEEIAYVPASEMLEVDGLDEEIIGELKMRAQNALLTKALISEEKIENIKLEESLICLEGMTEDNANILAKNNILTQEDLAELSIDELKEFIDLDEKAAGDLIMKARAIWFE